MSGFLAVAFGGGRNGAMLLGMYERGIKPDIITFANTGTTARENGEKPQTYEHVDRMSKWCEDHFGIPITEVHKNSQYASLYDQSIRTKSLPSAAYGLRSCSDKWKIQPQDRFMNNYPPALAVWDTCSTCGSRKDVHIKQWLRKDGKRAEKVNGRYLFALSCPSGNLFDAFHQSQIVKAIGYDAGEQRRAKITESDKYRYRYFLIEWDWFLEDCIAAYSRHGLPVPVKSACYYCPSSTKEEVVKLHEESPELFWSAVALEDNAIAAGTLQSVKGLGRHWTWRDLVSIKPAERESLMEAPQMACACFDGED